MPQQVKDEDEDQPMNVEYVSEQLDVKGAALEAFSDVFARFQAPPDSSAVRTRDFVPPVLSLNSPTAGSRY